MNITPKPRHDTIVTVRMTKEMYEKLKKDAKQAGVSVAEVVRNCVENSVKEV